MKMKKLLFVTVFAVLTIVASATDLFQAKIIYTNGNVKKGFAKFPKKPESKNIEFRATEDGEKQSIKSEELSCVVYYNDKDSLVFEKIATVSLWNKKKTDDPLWMSRVIKNYLSLYSYSNEGYSHFVGNSWHDWPTNNFYVCKKTDEPTGTIIAIYSAGTVNNNATFKHYASNYFADCAELVKKIENKEITYKKVIDAVNFYNQWKSKK